MTAGGRVVIGQRRERERREWQLAREIVSRKLELAVFFRPLLDNGESTIKSTDSFELFSGVGHSLNILILILYQSNIYNQHYWPLHPPPSSLSQRRPNLS